MLIFLISCAFLFNSKGTKINLGFIFDFTFVPENVGFLFSTDLMIHLGSTEAISLPSRCPITGHAIHLLKIIDWKFKTNWVLIAKAFEKFFGLLNFLNDEFRFRNAREVEKSQNNIRLRGFWKLRLKNNGSIGMGCVRWN